MSNNYFKNYSSKIKELHIPLPNFKYFHKPSSEEDVFPNYIGREDISEQLEEWLINGDSGSYLVTGYRGMGKSSFVGKVLNRITRRAKNNWKVQFFTLFCSLFMISLVLLFFLWINHDFFLASIFDVSYKFGFPENDKEWFVSMLLVCGVSILGCSCILIRDFSIKYLYKCKRWWKDIDRTDYENHKNWFEKTFKLKNIKASKHNLVIKLNLGHETLKEKDILSLIAKRIYASYRRYLNDFYTNWIRIITKNIALFVGAILIVWFLDAIDITSILHNSANLNHYAKGNSTTTILNDETHSNKNVVLNATNGSTQNIKDESNNIYDIFYSFIKKIIEKKPVSKYYFTFLTPILITKIILVFVFYFLLRRLWNFIMSYIPFLHKHSTKAILEQLQFLIDRIEAAVTEDSGPNSGYSHSTSLFSFNISRRKNKTYPNASTREIEDELILILEKIQATRSLIQMFFESVKKVCKRIRHSDKKLHQAPKFIIVFDELDKIDPIYNQVIKTEKDVPEFEAATAFQGGSAIRNRKQNVLKLLGNMKLFMSQAKAKFVFISGRELYDAFLADLADREFAASSIFNGVIYVDSFLESSTKQKNILTKTEEYICGYLIPIKWYKNEAKQSYYREKGKDKRNLHQKLENISYPYPNLRMYKKFLIETLIKEGYIREMLNYNLYISIISNCIRERMTSYLWGKVFGNIALFEKITNLEFENYDGFSKEIKRYESQINENNLSDIEQIFLYIDKVIVFLNQFSTYLTHVCNGSPKKITIYFEQYIKLYISKHPKNPFKYSRNKTIEDSKYCLSFLAIDQQNIGFINYMTYPIVQSVINQTSHFGDKMLVSVAFLIDHIFKHHKGGFSRENIEHTPELLEVYHIPNLRNIIDRILSFLHQNHVTNIYGGVYEYKFRKSIADEIMYNSRISEEISAIFNFTLDESLPVKRYYYKQINDNEKKYLVLEEGNRAKPERNQYAVTLISQLETLAEIHLLDEEYNEAIQHFQTAFEIIKSELNKSKEDKDKNKLHLYVLLIKTTLKLGLSKECKGYYNEAFVIYNTLLDYLVGFRYLNDEELGLGYFYEDNVLREKNGEWTAKKIKFYHNILGIRRAKTQNREYDGFYNNEVLPFYRQQETIQNEKIDFLIDGDYTTSSLSKISSPKKQEIISRITLFSEVRSVYQVILANLFVVEKIDVNGITQENLDLAEDQFKYIYLLTDSKDKFIQAADFYKKLASILFLKNCSNPKADEYLQMWGFDIYETINEFCFIYSDKYNEQIASKFPKEILKEFFIDKTENLWKIYIDIKSKYLEIKKLKKEYLSKIKKELLVRKDFYEIRKDIIEIKKKLYGHIKTNNEYIEKQHKERKKLIEEKELEKLIEEKEKELEKLIESEQQNVEKLIDDFISFSIKKLDKYFKDELSRCNECYKICRNRQFNHPCYACNYVSKSLDIFRNIFQVKDKELSQKNFKKRKSYFFKLLDYFKKNKTNSNDFFVLASALRIKADVGFSCINDNNNITYWFLDGFLDFLKDYYDNKPDIIDEFITTYIETNNISKLEKTILYHWLSAEYFYLNNSPVDSSECLTKILLILDKYLSIEKELYLLGKNVENFENPFKDNAERLFEKIQDTIVRKVIRNNNNTNNDVNYIETQNLKYILRYRSTMHLNLSNLSITPNIGEVLFSYCKLEQNVINLEKYIEKDRKELPTFLDCYKSTLLSQNRLSFTIHEKILSMEFKERMNMSILEELFKKHGKKLNFYDCEFQIEYFSFLLKFITENKSSIYIQPLELFKPDSKINDLLSLISDSLFCLTQIIEVLSSDKLFNFSHSFIGDIYHQISKWATLYQLTSNVLRKYHSYNKDDMEIFKKHEINTMCNRNVIFEKVLNSEEDKEQFKSLPKIADFKKTIDEISEKMKKEKISDRGFEANILDDIGTGNRHFLVPNYSIAMALKYYHKTIEVNSEGKTYKEMIKKMYIIDDDISNGMHNFSLALERYTMNCEVIEKKMEMLRKYYKNSLSYPLENYLKDTGSFDKED